MYRFTEDGKPCIEKVMAFLFLVYAVVSLLQS